MSRTSGTIATRQDDPAAIRLLAAISVYYGRARLIRAFEVWFIVFLPSALSTVAAFAPQFGVTAALWGCVLAILDVAFLYPRANWTRKQGAQLQERFDVLVLAVPFRPSRLSGAPDIEAIEATAQRKLCTPNSDKDFRDWYPVAFARLTPPLDKLACQRSNSVWDDGLRGWFQNALLIAALIGTITLLAIHVYERQPGDELITALLFPLLPAYLWVIREWQDQNDARSERRELRRLGSEIWDGFLDGRQSEASVELSCDDLQGAIFISRATAPPVPQILYKLLRSRFEREMILSAEALVVDAKKRRPELVL